MKNPFKHWWLILLKGAIFLILAFIAFFQPASALIGLSIYIGISLLITGLFASTGALINYKTDDNFGWHLSIGLLDILFATILITIPAITAAVFPFIVGFWTLVYGIMMFTNSFKTKKAGDQYWWTETFGGVLTLIIGYLIMINPILGALTITFWIGLGFLIFGALNISLAMRLKKN